MIGGLFGEEYIKRFIVDQVEQCRGYISEVTRGFHDGERGVGQHMADIVVRILLKKYIYC